MPVITSHHNVLKEKESERYTSTPDSDILNHRQLKYLERGWQHGHRTSKPIQSCSYDAGGESVSAEVELAEGYNHRHHDQSKDSKRRCNELKKKDYSHLPFTNICQTTHLRLIFVPLIPSTDAKVRERSCY